MSEDYKAGDNVFWVNPANGMEVEATIVREGPSQGTTIAERVRCFEIRVKFPGKAKANTMTVRISELRGRN